MTQIDYFTNELLKIHQDIPDRVKMFEGLEATDDDFNIRVFDQDIATEISPDLIRDERYQNVKAITTYRTYVLIPNTTQISLCYVYYCGTFGYAIKPNDEFMKDVDNRCIGLAEGRYKYMAAVNEKSDAAVDFSHVGILAFPTMDGQVALSINWASLQYGVGEYLLFCDANSQKLHLASEHMDSETDRSFIKALLGKVIDEAVLEN